jgi:hypothetical protein
MHSISGVHISDVMSEDMHSGLTYVYDYDLAADDTLYFFSAMYTTANYVEPYGLGPGGIGAKALELFNDSLARDPGGCCDLPGDINNNGSVDISDLTYYVDYMFNGGLFPPCFEEGDVNGSCGLDISDLTYFVNYMFAGGPGPHCAEGCIW